jgi:YVTN family beta-propeller protein
MKVWAGRRATRVCGQPGGAGRRPGTTSALAAAESTAVFVTNSGSDTISVLDGANDAVVATIPVGQTPWAVTVSKDAATAS